MKFVPQSDRKRRTGPQTAVNLLNTFTKFEDDRDPSTSLCTTVVTRQVKMSAQRLFSATPRIHLALMIHGRNTLTLTFVYGGSGLKLANGIAPGKAFHRFKHDVEHF